MLDHRRRPRFLEETLQPLVVRSDVRAHDLDHAQLVEVDVANLEDLTHAADAQTVEDLVLAVDQARRIRALETRHALAACRALLQVGVNRFFTAETVDLGHRTSRGSNLFENVTAG